MSEASDASIDSALLPYTIRTTMNVDDLLAELDDLPGHGVTTTKKERTSNTIAPSRYSSSGVTFNSGGKQAAPLSSSGQNLYPSSSQPMQTRTQKNEAVSSEVKSCHHFKNSIDQIDNLLDDLDLDSPSVAQKRAPPLNHAQTAPNPRNSAPATAAKCMSLFIGGAGSARGRNGSLVGCVLGCDTLRCTKCDFKVIWYENRAWKGDVDYLFFRNNYPTESKLLPKLSSSTGSRAYCCQCSWRSTSDQTVVDSFSGDLRWVCGGHMSN